MLVNHHLKWLSRDAEQEREEGDNWRTNRQSDNLPPQTRLAGGSPLSPVIECTLISSVIGRVIFPLSVLLGLT